MLNTAYFMNLIVVWMKSIKLHFKRVLLKLVTFFMNCEENNVYNNVSNTKYTSK